jgi:tetratricopeptide (TPR) repeat protein
MRIRPASAIALYAVFLWGKVTALPLSARESIVNDSTRNAQNNDLESLIRAGHWKRARAIVEPRVKVHPDDSQACYYLAEVKFAFKDLRQALPLAQHAVELNGQNSNYHLELGKIFGELAARASMISAGTLAVKFRKQVEIAIQLDPGNVDALDAMALFKYQAPGIMGGNKEEAKSLAEKITLLNPAEGYLSLAELAELEKNPAQEEAFLIKAIEASPGNYDAHAELAKFYSRAPHTNYDGAAKQAHNALHLDPQRIEPYWILARVAAVQQRWSDLDQVLNAAERNVADDLRPFYEAGHVLMETGRELPRAESYAKKYLSHEPDGEEPDAADGHRLLGLVLEKEGRKDEARAEISAALTLRPDFKAAKEDLKRINH